MQFYSYNLIYGSLFYVLFWYSLNLVLGLTGHVCSRQKAETYETTYDRAFICPERYTTACGQLDWRRCSKYRVNTCYTPTQKYAIRYKTVEECCPGWEETGSGECTSPVCIGGCENGGICGVMSNSIPGCICSRNYYGNRCQYGQHDVERITIYVVLIFIIFIALAVILHIYCRRLHKRSNIIEVHHMKKMTTAECEQLLPETSPQENEAFCENAHRGVKTPSAPF